MKTVALALFLAAQAKQATVELESHFEEQWSYAQGYSIIARVKNKVPEAASCLFELSVEYRQMRNGLPWTEGRVTLPRYWTRDTIGPDQETHLTFSFKRTMDIIRKFFHSPELVRIVGIEALHCQKADAPIPTDLPPCREFSCEDRVPSPASWNPEDRMACSTHHNPHSYRERCEITSTAHFEEEKTHIRRSVKDHLFQTFRPDMSLDYCFTFYKDMYGDFKATEVENPVFSCIAASPDDPDTQTTSSSDCKPYDFTCEFPY